MSAEVTPVFKKEDELNKENYCPVSVLSHPSKIFERIVFNQMNLFFESVITHKIFEANSGFYVKWRTAGKV